MTGAPEEPKLKGPSQWPGPSRDRVASLTEYFVAGAERYTPEALHMAARDASFTPEEIDEAYGLAAKRRHEEELTAPIRGRARRIVLAAYGLVLVAFAAPLLTVPSSFNVNHLALTILAIMLGFALLISRTWINGRRPSADQVDGALVTMLAVPIVLLIAVAGLCAVSVGPSALGLA